MRRKTIWIGAFLVLVLAAASAAALADIGGSGAAQEIEIIKGPPGGGSCVCPAIYEPVVCVAPDGSYGKFSSACVAGCYGFTHCVRIVNTPTP
jgi:hypothetical protein